MTDEEWALIRSTAEKAHREFLFPAGGTHDRRLGWVTLPASLVLNMCDERDRLKERQ